MLASALPPAPVKRGLILPSGDSPSSYMLGLCPFPTLCHVISSMYLIPSQFTHSSTLQLLHHPYHTQFKLSFRICSHALIHLAVNPPLLTSPSKSLISNSFVHSLIHYTFSSLMTSIFDLKHYYLLQDCHWTFYP